MPFESAYRRKGRTILSEAREVVRCVIEACEFEYGIGGVHYPLCEPTKRAAFYTRFSERTICRIREEAHAEEKKSSSCSSEEEKDGQAKQTDDSNDTTDSASKDSNATKDNDFCTVQLMRRTLMDFYLVNKVVPTWSQVVAAVRKKRGLKWGGATYRRLLRDIGFKRKKFENHRKILVERPEMSLWRFKYMKSIRKAREDKKNIVYIADTWVDNKLNVRDCWHTGEWAEWQISRFIILEAANANGFVENAQHIIKVGQTTKPEDLLTYENFKKWLTDKLLPNIPDNSVVVLDGDQAYHTVEQNKPPSKYSTKEDMIAWLEENSVQFNKKLCKVELMDIVNKFKTDKKVYCVDEQLKVKGHTVLRLPPYMCELNPLHAAWEKIDSILRVKKESEASSLTLTSFKKLRAIIVDALASITQDDWKGFCDQVQKREEDYWTMDATFDAEMEKVIAEAESGEVIPNSTESGSEFSESSDEECVEWPPFEMVECGEDPTIGNEQSDRRPSILESILEKPKTMNRTSTNRTPAADKKRKRKDDKETQANGEAATTSTDKLSSVDVAKLKNEMQEVLNKKVRVDPPVNDADANGASCSSSSDPFAEVLIKEEVSLFDVPAVTNVFADEPELPVVEIKKELTFLEESNPLDTDNMN